MRLHLSAKQTAAIIPIGGLISAAGLFSILFIRRPHSIVALIATFGFLIAGFLISWRANESLQAGIRQDRWPPAEVEQLRTFAKSRTLTVVHLALAFGVFANLSSHLRPWGWSCFVLAQAIFIFRNGFREQSMPSTYQPPWTNITPLNSDHWGQR